MASRHRAQRSVSSSRPSQPSAPALSYKPTDITIPHSLDKLIPEVELYRKLQDAERRIDLFTSRKWIDLQESLNKYSKKTGVLRIFIYNTCDNQPWQKQLAQQNDPSSSDVPINPSDSSWTLRVEGRLIDDEPAESPTRRKFSSFLTGISVDLIPNENYPTFENGNIIEWHDNSIDQPSNPQIPQQPIVEFDGLDVKRNGIHNLKTKIVLQLKELPLKMKLSDALANLIGIKEATQQEVVYAIWQYIKFNKLQSKEDFKMVTCDENLFRVFGIKSFHFPQLIPLIQKNMAPKPPIIIDFEINTKKSSTLGDLVIDVQVDLEDPNSIDIASLKENFISNDLLIKDLDSKISLGTQALNNSRSRQDFYKNLSKDPVNFLKNWLESHSNSLKIMSGDHGFDEETVRRSEFYTDELINENINLLLNTNRI